MQCCQGRVHPRHTHTKASEGVLDQERFVEDVLLHRGWRNITRVEGRRYVVTKVGGIDVVRSNQSDELDSLAVGANLFFGDRWILIQATGNNGLVAVELTCDRRLP